MWLPIAAALLLLLVLAAPFRWHPHATARTTPNGGVILGWTRAPQAQTYVVRFLDPAGRTIDTIEDIETLELVLTREALPRHLTPGTKVRWTVTALRSAHEVGKSEPKTLQLP